MNEQVNEKLNKIIDELDKSALVKDIKNLKEKVHQDTELTDLLTKFHEKEKESNQEELIELKKRIIANPNFSNYKEKENELYYLVLEINNRLKQLTSEKSCSHENN